ncbi:MAG TPA: 6-phosphogluconolactonase [Bryobacteraceae bacterium]|nr:6-phosphogluconolactonase [Bryobacteraceae bacterium]
MAPNVHVFETVAELAAAAAARAADCIRSAVAARGGARVVVATGNSQIAFIETLTALPGIPWPATDVFHMDEYAGLPAAHPASFRRWIRERVAERVRARNVHYINGEASDLALECRRYSDLLLEGPLDLAFVGIGENGHIAFNDPHEARFDDHATVKVVTLDEACRRQQTGEGHFASVDDVPGQALSMTCPALIRPRHLVCCVPDRRKAAAVAAAVEGPLTEACPASLLRTHADAHIYLDRESASLLQHRK